MRAEVVEKRLASLPELSRKGKRINGLGRLLTCPRIWEQAYEAISSNKGALTPGVDPNNTLEGFSLERMDRVISHVKAGTYKFAPVRRHYIPKANGKMRPLGIPNADDKLVQSAVKIILEAIYEPIFSDLSHGFRPGHSCHTALDHIQRVWHGAIWLVDVDIVGFFDNIDHNILLNLLRKRIDDESFLKLIKGMLAAGYMENWTWQRTISGTPQGGVISPILANVYLHELDVFMERMRPQFNRGRKRQPSPEWDYIRRQLSLLRQKVERRRSAGNEGEAVVLLEQVRDLQLKALQLPSQDMFDPGFRRLNYVRYADDFLIGIIGSKEEAKDVFDKVRTFLKKTLCLDVSEEKSGIRKATEDTSFLGYTVRSHTSSRIQRLRRKDSPWVYLRRDGARRLQLHSSEEKLVAFVKRQRLGNYHEGDGVHRPEFENLSDLEILSHFNAIMRGLAEYYKLGTTWRTEISRVHHVWWWSLMKTLAHKHKCSVAKVLSTVITKHQGDRGLWYVHKGTKRFRAVFTLKHIKNSQPETNAEIDRSTTTWHFTTLRTDLTDRLRARICEGCGQADVPMEIHHARKLSDVSHVSAGTWIKAARQRKRLALCRPCHLALHRGTLQARLDQLKASVGAG